MVFNYQSLALVVVYFLFCSSAIRNGSGATRNDITTGKLNTDVSPGKATNTSSVSKAPTPPLPPPPPALKSMNLELHDSHHNKNSGSATAAGSSVQGPQFVPEASKNVTALAGRVASLTCRIKNLDNWTVSWVRHRDVHLLTVAGYTYSADQRFRAVHKPYFGEQPPAAAMSSSHNKIKDLDSLGDTFQDWGLEIHSAQQRDSGIYECQISTTPHRSLFVHLRVVEPSTTVLGGSEVFVGMGSTINLTCVIRLSPEPPNSIRWQHNNQIIGYDSNRGGVSVVTEKGVESSSSLLIQNARPADSGKYICRPDNAEPATVNVHVLNGESPAAMQHGCSPRQLSSSLLFFLSVALACAFNVKAQRHIWSFIYGVT